jgi:hypothetical protein
MSNESRAAVAASANINNDSAVTLNNNNPDTINQAENTADPRPLSQKVAESHGKERVDHLLTALDDGLRELLDSEKYKNYLRAVGKFHNYSAGNIMLALQQNPDISYLAGFNKWTKEFNRGIRKGQKAIHILAPVPYTAKVEMDKICPNTRKPILNPKGEAVTEMVEVSQTRFKSTTVFDISQTYVKDKDKPDPLAYLTQNLKGDVENYDHILQALTDISPVPVLFQEISNIGDGEVGRIKGYYSHGDKNIVIDSRLSELHTIKTLIHEMSHAKIHAIDKDKDPKMKLPSKEVREVEAESIAFVVASKLGLDTSEYSFPYIAGWSSTDDLREFRQSIRTIRDTAVGVIEPLEARIMELQSEKLQSVSVDYAFGCRDLEGYAIMQSSENSTYFLGLEKNFNHDKGIYKNSDNSLTPIPENIPIHLFNSGPSEYFGNDSYLGADGELAKPNLWKDDSFYNGLLADLKAYCRFVVDLAENDANKDKPAKEEIKKQMSELFLKERQFLEDYRSYVLAKDLAADFRNVATAVAPVASETKNTFAKAV